MVVLRGEGALFRRTGVRWGRRTSVRRWTGVRWVVVLRRSKGGRRMVVLGGPASRHGTVVFRRKEGARRMVVGG